MEQEYPPNEALVELIRKYVEHDMIPLYSTKILDPSQTREHLVIAYDIIRDSCLYKMTDILGLADTEIIIKTNIPGVGDFISVDRNLKDFLPSDLKPSLKCLKECETFQDFSVLELALRRALRLDILIGMGQSLNTLKFHELEPATISEYNEFVMGKGYSFGTYVDFIHGDPIAIRRTLGLKE